MDACISFAKDSGNSLGEIEEKCGALAFVSKFSKGMSTNSIPKIFLTSLYLGTEEISQLEGCPITPNFVVLSV